jgi:hypothetical protein
MADEQQERIEQHQRKLLTDLTDQEKMKRGNELAMAAQDLASAREESKSIKAQAKAKEAEITARIDGLAATIRMGKELREVWCYGLLDLPNGRVQFYREDTGEKVGDRAIRAEERQTSIPGTGLGVIDGGKAAEPFNPPRIVSGKVGDDDVPPKTLAVDDYTDRRSEVEGITSVMAGLNEEAGCGHLVHVEDGQKPPALCSACEAEKGEDAPEGEPEEE